MAKPKKRISERHNVYKPAVAIFRTDDPLGSWKTLNAMLAANPPPDHNEMLLKQFAAVGIGPGSDVDQPPAMVKNALQRVLSMGMPLLRQPFMSEIWAKNINGRIYHH